MAAVAVVTDSTSDVDSAMQARYGIDVVPLFVNFGDTRYRDTIELSRDAFYAKLRHEAVLPTTSQPTPAMFEDAFRPHAAAGRAVVCLTIMSRLSGTMNAASAAALQFPDAAIHVVDSKTVSGGLALQAIHAAELARAGADLEAILAALAADGERGRGYATIPDLSHAVRTGRISRAQAFIGSLVKIVPVLRIDAGPHRRRSARAHVRPRAGHDDRRGPRKTRTRRRTRACASFTRARRNSPRRWPPGCANGSSPICIRWTCSKPVR